jgi:hypothetical protein
MFINNHQYFFESSPKYQDPETPQHLHAQVAHNHHYNKSTNPKNFENKTASIAEASENTDPKYP